MSTAQAAAPLASSAFMITNSVPTRCSTFKSGLARFAFVFSVSICSLAAITISVGQTNNFNTPRPPAVSLPSAPPAPAPPQESSTSANGVVSLSAPRGYQLSPNDQVAVEVFGEDDLRTNGRLNAEGNLSVPLLGSVHLAGLTLTQAATRLTELYGRDYLVNPKLSVSLIGYAKRRFTLLGQINRPGSYEMPEGSPEGVDLLEAIAMAGGYTRTAAPGRISVRRHSATGGDQVLRVDGRKLAKDSSSKFRVISGDTITVGESIF